MYTVEIIINKTARATFTFDNYVKAMEVFTYPMRYFRVDEAVSYYEVNFYEAEA